MKTLLAGVVVLMGSLVSAAINAATGTENWPGPLDLIRQEPWWWTFGVTLAAMAVTFVLVWLQERGPAADDGDPSPPLPTRVPEWVVDRDESRRVVDAICANNTAAGITTSLEGAGGFGKTTLAQIACADPQIRKRFNGRIYTVTIGRGLQGETAIARKVVEVTRFITGDTTEFTDPNLAGDHLGRLLDLRPPTLLVLDDVWKTEQLAPFIKGGSRCVRLFTTRAVGLVPPGTYPAQVVRVDKMSLEQARAVLTRDLPILPESVIGRLLEVTGRWALLLRLTNRLIVEQIATGVSPEVAASNALTSLRIQGPAAVDDPTETVSLDIPEHRALAVRATMEAATTLLPPGGADRFTELGVFAEDESIPIPLISSLWHATGNLTDFESRSLCRKLERLSLLTISRENGGKVTLHDVIRDYLRGELGEQALETLHGRLVDTVAEQLPTAGPLAATVADPQRAWWQLQDSYLLNHLIGHIIAAGRTAQAAAVAGDIRWVETRLTQYGPTAPWSDLGSVPTADTEARARTLAQAAHLLSPTDPPRALIHVLHNRLGSSPQWRDQILARQQDATSYPALIHLRPPPDLPETSFLRTLAGQHTMESVAVGPDGTWVASGGAQGVQIWDLLSGTCTSAITEARSVRTLAIAPDGTWLATGHHDGAVRIWDRASGACTDLLVELGTVPSLAIAPDGTWLATAHGSHGLQLWDKATGTRSGALGEDFTSWLAVAIAPDGTWFATGHSDGSVRIWDTASRTCTDVLTDGGGTVWSVSIAANGAWLASSHSGGSVRTWDRASGTCTATLTVDSGWNIPSVAIAPNGTWLATAGHGGPVQIWDRASGTRTATLTGHTEDVLALAIAPDGTWLASGSEDKTVRVWDTAAEPVPTSQQEAPNLTSVAIAPNTTWVAATGYFNGVRIWNTTSGICTATLSEGDEGHSWQHSVAVSSDGTWLATVDGVEVRIWDPAIGTCTTAWTDTPGTVYTGRIETIAIAPDGTWLATGGRHRRGVAIWDPTNGNCTSRLGQESHVESLAIAPDGTWLASAHMDGVSIWDRASGTADILSTSRGVSSLAISPCGTWLATAGHDGHVRIWDPVSCTCTATLTGHTDWVRSVAISPDGRWLATAGMDKSVRIWERASGCAVTLDRTEGELTACSWASNGLLAVAGGRGLYMYQLHT